jgi:hypothetical protein
MIRYALAVVLVSALTVTQAQPIYRCGPGGKIYSQAPCAEGTVMDASDGRTAAQRAEAKRVAAQERKTADDLERERKAREKLPASTAGSLSAAPATPTASSAVTGKTRKKKPKAASAQTNDFVAVAPKARKPAAPK